MLGTGTVTGIRSEMIDLVVPLKATAQARLSVTRHDASDDATTLSPVPSYIEQSLNVRVSLGISAIFCQGFKSAVANGLTW